MTGRAPQGRPRRDTWRGVRDDAPAAAPRGTGHDERTPGYRDRTRVEVEELSTDGIAPRARSRVPLTGVLAVAGVALLLAAGLGLLGGRPGSPQPSAVASATMAIPSATAVATAIPAARVTPWTPCSEAPARAPQPVLEVDGRQYIGEVSVLEDEPGPSVDRGTGLSNARGSTIRASRSAVDVPMDAVTEIWIPGGVCAVEWSIVLTGETNGHAAVLDVVENEDLDPAVASQNRFEIVVAPHAGQHTLRATLVLEKVAIESTWAIRVPDLEPPAVRLSADDRRIEAVVGCDVTQLLANGIEERLTGCDGDVAKSPSHRADVAPGEQLEFEIDGWAATNTTVYCGQLAEQRFVPRIDPACVRERDPVYAGLRFNAPDEAGGWTLAISTCGTRFRAGGRGFEELCGTWYANVRVRG